jgi:hypothetical protein
MEASAWEHQRQVTPLRNAVLNMREWAAAASKVHSQVLESLLARGWCHSYQFTDQQIVYLSEWLADGMESMVNEFMAEFTRRQVDLILRTACEKYPTRAPFLTDAFDAHRAGKYTLSIPALLAQLDGIGCEVLGLARMFFHQKNRENGLSAILSSFKWPWDSEPFTVGGINKLMLSALRLNWSLAMDTNKREEAEVCSPLNRNGVLHGLDTDYPTEFNSLRCVLLLGFLLEVRQVLREDIPRHLEDLGKLMSDDRISA